MSKANGFTVNDLFDDHLRETDPYWSGALTPYHPIDFSSPIGYYLQSHGLPRDDYPKAEYWVDDDDKYRLSDGSIGYCKSSE